MATNVLATNNKDNLLDAANPTVNYGGLTAIAARFTAIPLESYRSIIHFTLPATPAGANTPTAVKLYLYKYSDADAVSEVEVHQLTQTGWVEAQATWNIYKTSNNWATPGGDFSATIVDTTISPLTLGVYGWENWDLGAGATNPIAGLTWESEVYLMLKYPAATAAARNTLWYSKEGTAGKLPYIEITYTLSYTLTTVVGSFILTGVNIILSKVKTIQTIVGQFILTGITVIFSGTGLWQRWKNQEKHNSTMSNGSNKHEF